MKPNLKGLNKMSKLKKISLFALSSLLINTALATSAKAFFTTNDARNSITFLDNYMKAWQGLKVKNMEFMVHNNFISAGGEKKFNYIRRLRGEAANSAGRQIRYTWTSSQAKGNSIFVKFYLDYTDQYKKYRSNKFYRGCQNVTFELVKFNDGKLYLIKEYATKAKCN